MSAAERQNKNITSDNLHLTSVLHTKRRKVLIELYGVFVIIKKDGDGLFFRIERLIRRLS